jgi:hypothetical protein
MRRSLITVALAAVVIGMNAGPAAAARPAPPTSPPGAEETVQSDQAKSPTTGPINRGNRGNGSN